MSPDQSDVFAAGSAATGRQLLERAGVTLVGIDALLHAELTARSPAVHIAVAGALAQCRDLCLQARALITAEHGGAVASELALWDRDTVRAMAVAQTARDRRVEKAWERALTKGDA